MMYKTYKNIIIVLVFVVFQGTSSCKNCLEANYQFEMQERFSPEIDSINVGDTLWMEASHSTTFPDRNTGQDVEFGSSSPGTNIRIFKFGESYPDIAGAINDFKFVTINGREAGGDHNPAENKSYYFDEVNLKYTMKVGFVAQQQGVYVFSVGNSLGIVKQGLGCEKASIEILNANIDKHHYYYQLWKPDIVVLGYESAHAYCFKVK